MYGLITALVFSGIALAQTKGIKSENCVLQYLHETLANSLTFIILIHVAAVFFHYYILKDSILERMWVSSSK